MGLEIEIPKNWKIVELKNVCQAVTGTTPPKSDSQNYGNDIPFVKPPQLFDKPVHDAPEKLSLKGAKIARVLPPNSVLVTCIGNLGRTAINTVAVAFNQQINALIPSKEVKSKFLFYQTQSWYFRKQLNELSSATTVAIVNKGKFETIEISLPPLYVQGPIVEKIEELFSELDKGIENLKTAQLQLKVYRQAVLKWAFVNETFKEYIVKDITEKIQIGPFGTQLHKEDYIENGIPLINPTHIKDGLIVADKSFTILESKRESLPNYILNEGDVIMGRRGEMARCGLVSKKEAGWFCGTGSLYFRPNLKLIDPVFLYYNLRSDPVKKYLEENAGGTTMANLNLKIVNNIPISIPSIEEQKTIVLGIESRLSVCDKMEETITASLQKAEALRQSILKRAFEGKLVKKEAPNAAVVARREG